MQVGETNHHYLTIESSSPKYRGYRGGISNKETMKLKECSICNKQTVLWKSNPKACKECWLKIKAQESLSPSEGSKTPQKSKSRSYRIKSVSDKKLIELKEYRKKRDAFMKGKLCEFPDCKEKATDLHHAKGRTGSLLADERHFKALCRRCHRWVEENPEQAKALGLSLSRLDKEER